MSSSRSPRAAADRAPAAWSMRGISTCLTRPSIGPTRPNLPASTSSPRSHPVDQMGKMSIGMLELMAEFESEPIRARTRDAVAAAAANGNMKGRPHTLTPEERAYPVQTYETRQLKIEKLCKTSGLRCRTPRRSVGGPVNLIAFGHWNSMPFTQRQPHDRDHPAPMPLPCTGGPTPLLGRDRP
ncbi:recombinase family protein [Rhodococcus sp. 077-4]|uniref:recombinase family protein n=1 Tax=Rhodococcus sp. 077-4 TaxID=2789271 RepID=UPI0039F622B1